MNKTYYTAGILLYTIGILISLIGIFSFATMGNELFAKDSYVYWINTALFISLLGDIVLLKYLYYRKYMTAFSILLLHEATFVVYYFSQIAVWSTLVQSSLLFATLGTGIIIDLVFIFSKAGARNLLKQAGVVGLVFSCIGMVLLTLTRGIPTGETSVLLQDSWMWLSLFGSLIVVFFLLNFYRELRSEKQLAIV